MDNEFRKSSINLFLLTTAASAINYVCQIAMGRLLIVEVYGVINAIFSFILVCSVPGTTFNLLAAKYVAEREGDSQKVGSMIALLLRMAVITGGVCFIVAIPANRAIRNFLGAGSPLIVLLTMAVVCLGFLPSVISGALSGVKSFIAVGLISLVVPAVKLLGIFLTALFAKSGIQQETLIMFFMFLGTSLGIAVGVFFLHKDGLRCRFSRDRQSGRSLFSTSAAVFVVNLVYTFLSNVDILSINYFDGGKTAGFYSPAMLLGRIIFYFVTALITVMLPYVASENSKGKNSIRILNKTLAYTAALSILVFIPINLFSKWFISLLYGSRYLISSSFIFYASLISILLSVLNILINYLIGIGKIRALLLTCVSGTLLLVAAILMFHATAIQILIDIAVMLAVLVVSNFVICFAGEYVVK